MAKSKKESEPPSLFDNLEMFAAPEKGEAAKNSPEKSEPKPVKYDMKGLTGQGPMKDL